MPQPYTFKQIKEYLQKQPALHFEGLEVGDVKGLTKFLNDFFKLNAERHTVRKDGTVDTKRGKRRSVSDIYRICHYYFPKITLTHVYRHLLKMIADKKALSAICEATHMRVYRGTDGYEDNYFNGDPIDEYQVNLSYFEELKQCPREVGSWGIGDGLDELKLVKIK